MSRPTKLVDIVRGLETCPGMAPLLRRISAAALADPGATSVALRGLCCTEVARLVENGFEVSLISKGWYRVSWADPDEPPRRPAAVARFIDDPEFHRAFERVAHQAPVCQAAEPAYQPSAELRAFLAEVLIKASKGMVSAFSAQSMVSMVLSMIGGSSLRSVDKPVIITMLRLLVLPIVENIDSYLPAFLGAIQNFDVSSLGPEYAALGVVLANIQGSVPVPKSEAPKGEAGAPGEPKPEGPSLVEMLAGLVSRAAPPTTPKAEEELEVEPLVVRARFSESGGPFPHDEMKKVTELNQSTD